MSKNLSLYKLGRVPNVAIVGTGWAVRVQLPAFRKAGLNITALWARTEEKAQSLASELKINFATSDYSKILQRQDVDVVSIVCPPFMHSEMAAQALRAGKHVLCDKPTAVNAQEAFEMLVVAKQHPEQLSIIDHELRFLPTFQKLRELLSQGKVGRLGRVEGKFITGSRLKPGGWDWWSEASKGGGIFGAIGSHIIDAFSWLTQRRVVSVYGDLHTLFKEREDSEKVLRPVTSDDDSFVQLKLEGDLPGTIQACTVRSGKFEFSLIFSGTEGTLVWDNSKLYWWPIGKNANAELILSDEIDKLESDISSSWGKGSLELGKALIKATTEGDTKLHDVAASFEDGWKTQLAVDASKASSSEQQLKTIVYS